MAAKNSIPPLNTLKDCFQFLKWLQSNGPTNDVVTEFVRRLRPHFSSVSNFKRPLQTRYTRFLKNVSTLRAKLLSDEITTPSNYNVNTMDKTHILDALLECTPKFLAALSFIQYHVDVTFTNVGGGDWASQSPNSGDFQTFFTSKNNIIDGGFTAGELKNVKGSTLVEDLKSILNKYGANGKPVHDHFRNVMLTTLGKSLDAGNTGNAVFLLPFFCELVLEDSGGTKYKSSMEKGIGTKTICWQDLQSHCQLLKQTVDALMRAGFSATGIAFKPNEDVKFAKNAANWFRDNLPTAAGVLSKMIPRSIYSKTTELQPFAKDQLYPRGFIFDGSKQRVWHKPPNLQDWNPIFQKFRQLDGLLRRLKEILDGTYRVSCEPIATTTEATKTEAAKPVATKTAAAKPQAKNAVGSKNQNTSQSGGKPATSSVTTSPQTPSSGSAGASGPAGPQGDRGPKGSPGSNTTNQLHTSKNTFYQQSTPSPASPGTPVGPGSAVEPSGKGQNPNGGDHPAQKHVAPQTPGASSAGYPPSAPAASAPGQPGAPSERSPSAIPSVQDNGSTERALPSKPSTAPPPDPGSSGASDTGNGQSRDTQGSPDSIQPSSQKPQTDQVIGGPSSVAHGSSLSGTEAGKVERQGGGRQLTPVETCIDPTLDNLLSNTNGTFCDANARRNGIFKNYEMRNRTQESRQKYMEDLLQRVADQKEKTANLRKQQETAARKRQKEVEERKRQDAEIERRKQDSVRGQHRLVPVRDAHYNNRNNEHSVEPHTHTVFDMIDEYKVPNIEGIGTAIPDTNDMRLYGDVSDSQNALMAHLHNPNVFGVGGRVMANIDEPVGITIKDSTPLDGQALTYGHNINGQDRQIAPIQAVYKKMYVQQLRDVSLAGAPTANSKGIPKSMPLQSPAFNGVPMGYQIKPPMVIDQPPGTGQLDVYTVDTLTDVNGAVITNPPPKRPRDNDPSDVHFITTVMPYVSSTQQSGAYEPEIGSPKLKPEILPPAPPHPTITVEVKKAYDPVKTYERNLRGNFQIPVDLIDPVLPADRFPDIPLDPPRLATIHELAVFPNSYQCLDPWSVTRSSVSTTAPTLIHPPDSDHLPRPQTICEMLFWLVGFNTYGLIASIERHIEGLLMEFNSDASRPKNDLEVTGYPTKLTASMVADELTEACLYSASVIYKIKYKDSFDAYETFFKDQENYAFYYSTDPACLLCQLRDYVYACHHQLQFLKAQCNRDKLSGGWKNHDYGSDITSSKSALQAFLTDGWDSDFDTHLFDPCNLCLKSRVRMGFKKGDLPDNPQTGSTLSTILTPSCGGSDPLLTLASYLTCLTRRTPRTTGELVSFFHHFGKSLHDVYSNKLLSLGSSLSTSHADCPDWDHLDGTDLGAVRGIRGNESLISKDNSDHYNDHPRTLSTLVGCGSDPDSCPQHCSPITYRAYSLYSPRFAHTYLSWAVYLPDRLWESLQKLHYDLLKHCGSGKCSSLYSCSTALPLLYTHGFTPPEVVSQPKLTCSDVIAKLQEIVDGKPIASLMTAMDNFLFTIREPFIFTIVALWSLALLIFANTMLYRIDILHIRSHLIRTKASHLIDVKALLSDSKKMMSLYDASYFDDDPSELLNLR